MTRNEMNIFEMPEIPLSEELITHLAETPNVRIERIISTGQVSADWYDQNETEFVVLLEGSAVVDFEDGRSNAMSKGDTLLIAPRERHRVSYTSTDPACVWLCVYY
jgi:cupin 2 domain-containing protein